jgi:SPP1 family phage portal protein
MALVTQSDLIKAIIAGNAPMTTAQIVTEEVKCFTGSPAYKLMLDAEKYWRNRSAVQDKTVLIDGRSNTKIEQPILRKLINQKTSYLLSSPFSIASENETYMGALADVFDDTLRRKIKGATTNAIKYGIGYLQPYFENGALRWARLPAYEVIPLWDDAEHEELNGFIRFYDQVIYEGINKRTITRAEFWTSAGVQYFISNIPGGAFQDDIERPPVPHFTADTTPYNWEQVPLVWLKYNEDELPLLYFLKEIIDDVNWQKSVTSDVLRDIVNFIFILKNYGGADLAEFIKGVKEHFAIKVDADGGVDKLSADLNIDAVMKYLDEQRRALYDFGSGVDTKDPDLGNASGTAINFRYMDLDADCRAIGVELKDAMQRMKLFIDLYLQATGKGSYKEYKIDVTFATDMPVNETDVITNCKNSAGTISQRTIVKNHPWVEDPDEEIKQLAKERKAAMQQTGGKYPGDGDDDDDQGGGTE